MTDQPSQYGWPDDSEDASDGMDHPSVVRLAVLYGVPILLLYLFPAVAWIALLPGALVVRRVSRPPHRRRLVGFYLVIGVISVTPWILLIARGDGAELIG